MSTPEDRPPSPHTPEWHRLHPIFGTDFSRPPHLSIREIRNVMARLRGQLSDLGHGYSGWSEQLQNAQGLLTCGISYLHDIMEEMEKHAATLPVTSPVPSTVPNVRGALEALVTAVDKRQSMPFCPLCGAETYRLAAPPKPHKLDCPIAVARRTLTPHATAADDDDLRERLRLHLLWSGPCDGCSVCTSIRGALRPPPVATARGWLTLDGSREMTPAELFRERHCAKCLPGCETCGAYHESHREGCTHVCKHAFQQFAPAPEDKKC